jgi:ABC-2 type transport system ATP-binding protein
MISVENLSKFYGTTLAVKDVSFKVDRGEVVGFLGPNGAGKTTTMRILAGSLGATSGSALIDGLDVFEKPREVKRRIGYLPEVPPVYGTMTVAAYTRFAARIKGVADVETATEKVLGRVGLKDLGGRLIDHLSKGQQQRVGLAQALVHEPDVLILDEPTVGLDPAQRVEIRNLIRELAEGERTIILSTHILPDVEEICQRVIIIDRGQVVAQDRIDALAGESRTVHLRVGRPGNEILVALRKIQGVEDVAAEPDGGVIIRGKADLRAEIARAAVPYDLLEMVGREHLEDIYLRLTSGRPVDS